MADKKDQNEEKECVDEEVVEEVATDDEPVEAAEPVLTAEELLQQERDDLEDKWLRGVAELENVRRRARRDVADAYRFATAEVLRPLLDVLDGLERALQTFVEPDESDGEAEEPDMATLRSGIEMVLQSFKSVLKSKGLCPIEAQGEIFDPSRHEAIQQLEVEGVESGMITEVVQTGYTLNDMVLRPSRVVVAG